MSQIHTSGHASIPDLQRLARAINARMVVPIHSFEAGRFPEFFDNVEIKEDGIWWDA
jgi:ribonuclease J